MVLSWSTRDLGSTQHSRQYLPNLSGTEGVPVEESSPCSLQAVMFAGELAVMGIPLGELVCGQ